MNNGNRMLGSGAIDVLPGTDGVQSEGNLRFVRHVLVRLV